MPFVSLPLVFTARRIMSRSRESRGHGPTLFAGLSKPLDVKLVSRLEYASGAVAMRDEPRRQPTEPRSVP